MRDLRDTAMHDHILQIIITHLQPVRCASEFEPHSKGGHHEA